MYVLFYIIILFLHQLNGIIPIMMANTDSMDFRVMIKEYAEAPIPRHLILKLLSGYQRPNDKISELLKSEELISIRRGLYIPGPKMDLPTAEPFLIANHLRGPSYVSLESALSYWGLIPERTYEISSVTTKTSKTYRTEVGRFSYKQLKTPYYAFGIKSLKITQKQTIVIASPEKALCDKIVLTPTINLRSIKQTQEFLLEDLRMDSDVLNTLNTELMKLWISSAPKKSSLKMLIKMLEEL